MMKVTTLLRGRKGFVVTALTAATAGLGLLQQHSSTLHLFFNESCENGSMFLSVPHSSLILFAEGWHSADEQQQHTLAAEEQQQHPLATEEQQQHPRSAEEQQQHTLAAEEQQQHTTATSLAEAEAAGEAAVSAPLFNEADCTYPSSSVGFEKVISPEMLRLLLERSPQVSYRGVSVPSEVAREIHKDISCAIQASSLFTDFCNTSDKATEDDNKFANLSECLAFLAHASVHTHFWTTFSDTSRGRECSLNEKYPCGPPTASYHGRGPFKLRGNEEYGAFGEAVFRDSARLLTEPELVEPQSIAGWAAALWKWMSERPYGLNCPETLTRSGTTSCHAAMLHQDSPADAAAKALRDSDEGALKDAVAGFGLTIHINGGTSLECCPSALEDFQRKGSPLRQSAAFSTAPAVSSPADAQGGVAASAQQPAAVNAEQQQQNPSGGHLLPSQEALFRSIMLQGGSGSLPASSPAPAGASGTPLFTAAVQAPTPNFPSASPVAVQSISAVAPAGGSVSPATLGGGAVAGPPVDAAPPVTAAVLLSTFLSYLSVALPLVPPTTDENAANVMHPFSNTRVPWPVPLPGSADGLCRTQGVLTLQAAAENAQDKDRGKAAELESRFCVSLLRGCPSLFPKAAAQVSIKSTDEKAAKAVEEATAKHPDNSSVIFKCFETTPAGLAAATAEAGSSSTVEMLLDDEEKMKEKLNSTNSPVGSFRYLPENGVTCAFFNTKL